MSALAALVRFEFRKSWRARMPIYVGLGYLIAPLACAFLMLIAKNPEYARQAGLISTKANLIGVSADWPFYLGMLAQVVGAGGMLVYGLVISWIFGREFADNTLKDLLAVPVSRASILLAKFIVFAVWSFALSLELIAAGLFLGFALQLPLGSAEILLNALRITAVSAGLGILVMLPFAFLASAGRGYLLPVGVIVLALGLTNLFSVIGYGSFFPWAVPMYYAQAKSPLPAVSYWIVVLTGLAGMAATYAWWMLADQSK